MIPLSNLFGWMLTGMGLIAILNLVLKHDRRRTGTSTAVPDFFLIWTWFGGIVGNIFFFDQPGIALIGGVVFGLYLIPYLFMLRFGPPDTF
jgi:putative membrane protein